MYDIYLSSGCHNLPDLSALFDAVPNRLHNCLFSKGARPGFLGLNLSGDRADSLLEQLERAGGRGFVVPAAYRQPKVTLEMATPIAEEVMAQKQNKRNDSLDSVHFLTEGPLWWKFGAASPELMARGVIPGAAYVYVDKLDGHLWESEELATLKGEEYYFESATSLKPQQILDLLADEGLTWGTDHRHSNQTCLKGAGFVMGAVEHSHPAFTREQFGFQPTVYMWFRLIPYKSGFHSAPLLLLQAVRKILHYDNADAVLLFENGSFTILLHSKAGELTLGEEFHNWAERRNLSPTPFLTHLPSLLATQAWRGIPVGQKMPDGKERWNGTSAPVRQPPYKIDRSKLAVVAT